MVLQLWGRKSVARNLTCVTARHKEKIDYSITFGSGANYQTHQLRNSDLFASSFVHWFNLIMIVVAASSVARHSHRQTPGATRCKYSPVGQTFASMH